MNFCFPCLSSSLGGIVSTWVPGSEASRAVPPPAALGKKAESLPLAAPVGRVHFALSDPVGEIPERRLLGRGWAGTGRRGGPMAPLGGAPRLVLLFSGKRKSGKDFVTEALRSRLGANTCAVLRLSGPLKEQYAQEHSLDFQRLLDSSTYKEAYRRDMIRWGEEKRQADPGYFCRKIVEGVSQPVWLVSDTRRVSDVQWFQEAYGAVTQTVRVVASEQSRRQRGWVFTPGVDDAESECGLDDFGSFDWVIENHGDEQRLEDQLAKLLEFVHGRLS